jgi:hypothetical protein
MKILRLALAAALATHASFALAQSTGSGISVLPPAKETAKETGKETSKDIPSAKAGDPATNQATTGSASGSRTGDGTSSTAGNPGIQSGRVK